MSEKSKGDTSPTVSSSAIPTPSRVVKNPLLSASVTGLTFDDFPNKPLLLPAAPPVIHAPPAVTPAAVITPGIINRESKSLVTVGHASSIDNETLSEINLNSSSEDTQPAAQIDTNSNPLLEQTSNNDSILSQAASSFSALPSVASSVFSTFSKRIYSASSSRERTPVTEGDVNANPISQLDIQPPYIQQHQQQQQQFQQQQKQQYQQHQQYQQNYQQQQQQQLPPAPSNFGASTAPPPFAGGNYFSSVPPLPTTTTTTTTSSLGPTPSSFLPPPPPPQQQEQQQQQLSSNEPPPEPPKFYTPSDLPALTTPSGPPPSAPPAGQNTYRLSAKKKIYAPIPGLSGQGESAPVVDASAIVAPIAVDSQATSTTAAFGGAYPPASDPYSQPSQQSFYQQPKQQEERRGGLFSITNLVPTGVLQNLSGLVQSAAGSIVQTVKPDQFQQQQQQQQQPPAQSPFGVNYFGAPQDQQTTIGGIPPASSFYQGSSDPHPTTNFFAPPSNNLAYPVGPQQQPHQQPQQQSYQQHAPPSAEPAVSLPPPPPPNSFGAQTPTPAIFDPTTQLGTPAQKNTSTAGPPSTVDQSSRPPSLPFFDPTKPQPGLVRPPSQPASHSETPRPPTQPAAATSSALPPSQPGVAPVQFFDPSQSSAAAQPGFAPTPVQFFDPNKAAAVQPGLNTTSNPPIAFFDPNRPPSQKSSASEAVQPPPPAAALVATVPAADPNNCGPPPSQASSLPPTSAQQPPPAAGGATTFRLQKGTKLYRNPLSSAETAPSYASPPLGQLPPAAPQAIFNPFGPGGVAAASGPSQSPALFTPHSEPQSVPLFAPEPKSEVPSTTSAGFFNPSPLFPVQSEEVKPPLAKTPPPTPLGYFDSIPRQEPLQSQAPPFSSSIGFFNQPAETTATQELHSAQSPLDLSRGEEKPNPEPAQPGPIGFFNPAQGPPPTQASFVPQLKPVEPEPEVDSPKREILEQSADQFEEEEKSQSQEIEPLGQTIEPVLPEPQLVAEDLTTSSSSLERPTEEEAIDPLEETLQKLSLPQSEASGDSNSLAANFLPPPPHTTSPQGAAANPYRKEPTPAHSAAATTTTSAAGNNANLPSLANFFTPIASDSDADPGGFNFFGSPAATTAEAATNEVSSLDAAFSAASFFNAPTPYPPSANQSPGEFFSAPQEAENPAITSQNTIPESSIFPPLPTQTSIAAPPLAQEPPAGGSQFEGAAGFAPPPIGFENFLSTPVPSESEVVAATQEVDKQQSEQDQQQRQNQLQEQLQQPQQLQLQQSQQLQLQQPQQPQQQLQLQQPATTPLEVVPSATTTTQQATPLPSISNFFNQTSNFPLPASTLSTAQPEEKKHSDPTSFFDTFAPPAIAVTATQPQDPQPPAAAAAAPSAQSTAPPQSNEDQLIQNFFNNPPPQEGSVGVGDLNYDLVHSGLAVRNLQVRSLTPASNVVEPPSSSCSEFSELSSSIAGGQRSIASAESSNKISPEDNKTPPVVEQTQKEEEEEEEEKKTSSGSTVDDPAKHYEDLPEEVLQALRMAHALTGEKGAASAPPSTASFIYTPAVKHWFYKRPLGTRDVWTPFSHYDSALLETTLTMGEDAPNLVAVEGGRYDVNIRERSKAPVYWEGEPIEVRRCSWFYKAVDSRYVPYEEEIADLLEAEYKQAAESGEWHKKIIISMGEQVVFHGPTVIVHFQQQQNVDAWGGSSQTTTRPRVVKRDLDDFTIDQGESQRVDHLLFMVHGIGSACDLKMRSVEEVVDEFRSIAQQLVQSHYKNSTDMGLVGRVEVLPISWHSHLHSEEMGIDEKLKSITLESIPKLRNFTNDTLLDVLFYTSPTFCQKIMNTVACSMNAVYLKYRQRHPEFSGGVSLAGHSLGSLILFDLLCHQNPIKECEEQNMENPDQVFLTPRAGNLDSNQATCSGTNEVGSKQISYTMGPAGTGQPFIHYSQLIFQPKKFFALGSPIGMFVTIRGIDKLGLDFRLPTCPGFYNIFHPFDPVAYRIEALVNPDMSGIRPVLIPHHKGRKRMHLELKETMTRVSADLKQRFFDTFKTTLESVNFLGSSSKSKTSESKESMEKEVLEMQMQLEQQQSQPDRDPQSSTQTRTRTDSTSTTHSDTDMVEVDFPLGKLNDSKRVDYVLQEAPLEFFNEYLFALSSHVCYWDSEDTILFVMKEIYAGLGVSPDSQVPQQSMTIERPSSRNSVSNTLLSPST